MGCFQKRKLLGRSSGRRPAHEFRRSGTTISPSGLPPAVPGRPRALQAQAAAPRDVVRGQRLREAGAVGERREVAGSVVDRRLLVLLLDPRGHEDRAGPLDPELLVGELDGRRLLGVVARAAATGAGVGAAGGDAALFCGALGGAFGVVSRHVWQASG